MLSRHIGRLVRQQREAQGGSQAGLARSARVSRTVVSRLEAGRADAVQTDVADRLFKSLGVVPSIGFGDIDLAERQLARLRHQAEIDARRERHLRLALSLVLDPGSARRKIARARRVVCLWEEKATANREFVDRWRKALAGSPAQVARAMTSFGDWENGLYQNSPWAFEWS